MKEEGKWEERGLSEREGTTREEEIRERRESEREREKERGKERGQRGIKREAE